MMNFNIEIFEYLNLPVFIFNSKNELIYINNNGKDKFGNLALSDYIFYENKDEKKKFDEIFIESNNKNHFITSKSKLVVDGLSWLLDFTVKYNSDLEIYLFTVDNYSQIVKYKNLDKQTFSEEICANIFNKLPLEMYFLAKDGTIIHKTDYAKDILFINNSTKEFQKLKEINSEYTDEWWEDKKSQLLQNSYIDFESIHNYDSNKEYKMWVNFFPLQINNELVFCYQSYNINQQYEVENSLIKEVTINKNLTEISSELAKNQKLEHIQLLVRQYALEITSSTFSFISYHDPSNNELTFSIYNDTGTNYDLEIKKIEKQLTKAYFSNNEKTEYLINKSTSFLIDEVPIFDLLPFKNYMIIPIVSLDDLMGFIFVANQNYEYEIEDADNLKSLSNLFAIAINRTIKNSILSESLEQLNLAMSVANMTIFDADISENKINLGGSSEKKQQLLFEYSDGISLRKFIKQLHRDDLLKLLREVRKQIFLKNNSFKVNVRILNRNNQYNWYLLTGKAITFSNSDKIEQITGIAMDITDLVNLNEEIIKSREIAVEANKAKSTFLARITHELRTPLNAIIGFADVLISNSTSNLHLNYLNNIKKSGILLLDLINDILDFSKIEAGKTELQLTETNIVDLVEEIHLFFQEQIIRKDLKFTIKSSHNTSMLLIVDELRIKQILTNLISNAIKFTDDGEVLVEYICSNFADNKVTLTFVVKDTGIGIKESSQKIIFDDFSQQADQDNRKYGGTGLGLGIVKSLVEMMKGTILLESEPNVGSTFTVTFPNVEVASDKTIIDTNTAIEENEIVINKEITQPIPLVNVFNNQEKKLWNNFKKQPSFNVVPIIAEMLRKIEKDEYIAYCNKTAEKLEEAVATFDVENLDLIIKNFEKYIANVD